MKKSILYSIVLSSLISSPAFSLTAEEQRQQKIELEIQQAVESTSFDYWFLKPSVMAKYLIINQKYCVMDNAPEADVKKDTPEEIQLWQSRYYIKLACDYAGYRYFQYAIGAIPTSKLLDFDTSDVLDYTKHGDYKYDLYGIYQ